MTASAAPIRVMVIDDHTMVREGIVALLQMQKEFEVVGEAGDGEAAIQPSSRITTAGTGTTRRTFSRQPKRG